MSQVAICDAIIAEKKRELGDNIKDDKVFELLVSDLVLRDFAPSWDTIEAGIVDAGDDGGIDSVYTFLGDNHIKEVEELDCLEIGRSPIISIFIIQSKNQASFKETPLTRIRAAVDDLAGLDANLESPIGAYNTKVVSAFAVMNETFRRCAGKKPKISVTVVYACKGEQEQLRKKR